MEKLNMSPDNLYLQAVQMESQIRSISNVFSGIYHSVKKFLAWNPAVYNQQHPTAVVNEPETQPYELIDIAADTLELVVVGVPKIWEVMKLPAVKLFRFITQKMANLHPNIWAFVASVIFYLIVCFGSFLMLIGAVVFGSPAVLFIFPYAYYVYSVAVDVSRPTDE